MSEFNLIIIFMVAGSGGGGGGSGDGDGSNGCGGRIKAIHQERGLWVMNMSEMPGDYRRVSAAAGDGRRFSTGAR